MKRLLALALVVCACAFAQNASLMPDPNPPFLDANGLPLAGGKLYSYAAGTTTPQATYTDATGTTPNTNPVILDAAGRAAPGIWLGSTSYKIVVKDATDVVQWTRDNITAGSLALSGSLAGANGANLIKFTAPGTAVARTLTARLADSRNVKDFGAVGDGVTDDTAAIQAAANYTNSVTGLPPAIYFPAGTYIVSSTVTLSKTAQTLYGDSEATSILKWAATASATIPMLDASNAAGGLLLAHLKIDGNGNRAKTLLLVGGGANNIFNDSFERVTFTSAGVLVDGIGDDSGNGLNDSIFSDCIFTFAGQYAIKLKFPLIRIVGGIISSNPGSGVFMHGNAGANVFGTVFSTNGYDVELQRGSNGFLCSGCWFENSSSGILKVTGAYLSRFTLTAGTNLHTNSTAALLDTTGADTTHGNNLELTITDSYVASAASYAVKLVTGASLVWSGNKGNFPTVTNTGGLVRVVEGVGSDTQNHVNIGGIDQTDNILNVITNNAAAAGQKLGLFRSEQGGGFLTVQVDQTSKTSGLQFTVGSDRKEVLAKDFVGDDFVLYTCTGVSPSEVCNASIRAKNATGNVIVGTSTTDSGDKLQVGGTATVSGTFKLPAIKASTGTRFLCVDTSGNVVSQSSVCAGT